VDLPAFGTGEMDRAANRREDQGWLAERWADPTSRVLVLDDALRVTVEDTPDGARLVLSPPVGLAMTALLGVDATGVAYFSASGDPPRRLDTRLAGLRDVATSLDAREAHLLVTAVALANWHASHPCCPRCGAPTIAAAAGFARRCPADESLHFPRTDPAVIMLVSDGDRRCLLGRRPDWPPGRFSTLAGFVEPGETAEQAVVREVREEVGLAVRDVRYAASQPWPFPASLMLGFTAIGAAEPPVLADAELEEAAWFDRAQLLGGEVQLPPPISIARRLIDGWLRP